MALLGDSAHAMQPNLGQGGCMAIEDAYQLGKDLFLEADQARSAGRALDPEPVLKVLFWGAGLAVLGSIVAAAATACWSLVMSGLLLVMHTTRVMLGGQDCTRELALGQTHLVRLYSATERELALTRPWMRRAGSASAWCG